MKMSIVAGFLVTMILIAGCEDSGAPPAGPAPQKPQQSVTPSAKAPESATPVAQPILNAWQQGDKSKAISSFLAADWNSRPLFASGSTLSLSEGQFMALSNADRQTKNNEMMPQITILKQLATAVADEGRGAASKGDVAKARTCFTSMKQFGTALDNPSNLQLVQLLGKGFKETADTELAKLGQ